MLAFWRRCPLACWHVCLYFSPCFQKHACSFLLPFIQHFTAFTHNSRPFDLQNSYCPDYNSQNMHTMPSCHGIPFVPWTFSKKILANSVTTKLDKSFKRLHVRICAFVPSTFEGIGLHLINLKSIDEVATAAESTRSPSTQRRTYYRA